jgi:hypothetical protein
MALERSNIIEKRRKTKKQEGKWGHHPNLLKSVTMNNLKLKQTTNDEREQRAYKIEATKVFFFLIPNESEL